jgi:NADPH-dependent glutamate synthase beta subunit-like oxidoreductase
MMEKVEVKNKEVLVIGGSYEGIQTALSLARQGNKVYLIENAPGLLNEAIFLDDKDKSFDTFSLDEIKANENIEIITFSDIKKIESNGDGFNIKIKRMATRVKSEKCNALGECYKVCPVNLYDEYNGFLSLRTAISYFPTGDKGYNIIKEVPICQEACPVGLDVRGYVGLISDGKYEEALKLIKSKLPFPAIIGRICPHPCEEKCNRGKMEESICIRDLKRFVADNGKPDVNVKELPEDAKKVAIIGAGPAGLACAHDLSQNGYKVTIFESLPVEGGMLAVGIPEYRLPRDILNMEIDTVKALGAGIKTGVKVGKDIEILKMLESEYNAVFVAVGAHGGVKLGIPGEDAKGVIEGVDFLRRVNLKEKVEIGKNVLVIGGGNVAIDAARCSLRLGSKVKILYRRTKYEMPASEEEIEAALAEGIDIEYLTAPVEVLANDGTVDSLKCIRMQLGEPDASGRRRPVPVSGSEFEHKTDTIIPAIGQSITLDFLESIEGIKISRRGTIIVDPESLSTGYQGIFAGGDCITGPGIAIEAIASGKKAAISIDKYLKEEV